MSRPRAVFDCNVLLQALVSKSGPAAESLRQMEHNRFELQLSRAILKEIRAVLQYPAIRSRNPALTDHDVSAFLDRLLFRGALARRVRHVFNYPRARQDEPYIDLAVACRADYLVTRDNDLHWLATGHTSVCKRFRQLTRPLRVVDPVLFLRELDRAELP